MPSFSTSLSGLDAESQALSVIANNLANLNTTAYKAATPNFQDLFYQQVGTSGSGDPVQIGVGATLSTVASNFTQGSIESTGVPTNVAIQGDGFLIENKGGLQLFTRAGNLSVGANGELNTADGGSVQGYVAQNGVISASQTLGALSIPNGLTNPPSATSSVVLTLNLNSVAATPVSAASQQTGTGIAAATVLATGSKLILTDGINTFSYTSVLGDTLGSIVTAISGNANFSANLTGNSLSITATNGLPIVISTNTLTQAAAGAAQSETFLSTAAPVAAGAFSTPVPIFDALGASHVLTFSFSKTASNTWDYSVTIPAAEVGQSGSPVVLKSGTLSFDGAGRLTSPVGNIAGIPISGFTDGAKNQTFDWNLYDANSSPLLTQVAGPSATSSTRQDGFASGTLVNYNIQNDGVIQGVFSNGQTLTLGQIALASFANVQGLQRNGQNAYLATLASGSPNVGTPTTGGRGSFTGGALEQSNVDIAKEFAQLILAERGYQANSKAVTTFDEVTQEAINLKR
jgi:flagellar hook protein FlgE